MSGGNSGRVDTARALVTAVVGMQLLLSARGIAKYSPVAPAGVFVLLVVAGTALAVLVLRSPRAVELLTARWVLVAALAGLTAALLVVYPRADGLQAVGRGSDQDDCVRLLVTNVLAGREPYSLSYLGHPCSTGPTELLPYLPLALSRSWFAVVPALALLLGWWVLRRVVDSRTATLLTVTQLASLLFLELAATGSDFILIGWLFAAAVVLTKQGLAERRRWTTAAGVLAYVLFAGSRVPLALTVLASLWFGVLLSRGAHRLVVAVAVVAGTGAAYLGAYLAGPSSFAPAHLIGKAARFVGDLGPALTTGLALAGLVVVALLLRLGLRGLAERHLLALNALFVLAPMGVSALGELAAKGGSVADWEGLNYLVVAVPAVLVAVAGWLADDTGHVVDGADLAGDVPAELLPGSLADHDTRAAAYPWLPGRAGAPLASID